MDYHSELGEKLSSETELSFLDGWLALAGKKENIWLQSNGFSI